MTNEGLQILECFKVKSHYVPPFLPFHTLRNIENIPKYFCPQHLLGVYYLEQLKTNGKVYILCTLKRLFCGASKRKWRMVN